MVLTKIPGGLIADGSITSADIQDSTITNAKMALDPTNASNLSSGSVPAAQLGNVPTAGLDTDIALLAFKTQANGNLARYNLVDQSVDAFEDASGVNASASTDETRDSTGKYYSGTTAGAYAGDGSDGALTTSGNVSLVVPNKVGSYDGDMVVKQYSSLTVSAGDTLTVDQPNRGLFIMVTGDCTINGTLSMAGRGGNGNPTISGASDSAAVSATGLRFAVRKTGSTDTLAAADFAGTGTGAVSAVASFPAISGDGKIYTVGRTGGAGGAGATVAGGPAPTARHGVDGAATLSSGGGGGGGGYSEGPSIYVGAGAAGSVFAGGPGGGGAYVSSGGITNATDGTAYGGAGGNGGGAPVYGIMSGGSGNPVGSGPGSAPQGNGVGGLLILIVGGNLTIGGSGSINANGYQGSGEGPGAGHSGGGGSGGGKVLTLHTGTLSNSGTITSTGGAGGSATSPANYQTGREGGDGHVVTEVVGGTAYNNMTLISNAQTAQAQPTKADVVLTYTNGAGTATINTDLIASVSRDGGTTYTATTLASQGTTGGHTILSASNVDISAQPAGTSMVWKVATANQSVSKQTRIHAVSLGWS